MRLSGEDIAPTDATEATRIVTWFRHGPTPKVTANHRGGRRSNVPITRNGGLTFDFANLDPEDVVDLDVEWPAAELIDTTIIDTPGTSSLVARRLRSAHCGCWCPTTGCRASTPWCFCCARSTPPTSHCSSRSANSSAGRRARSA